MIFVSLDIDECAENIDICHANAQCTNTPGNYTCACRTGFTGNGFVCIGEFIYYRFIMSTLVIRYIRGAANRCISYSTITIVEIEKE